MKKYLYIINAPTPSFSLPGIGYVRKEAGETILLEEAQRRAVESPGFAYKDYFSFVEEVED
jgi:hypothetical protein